MRKNNIKAKSVRDVRKDIPNKFDIAVIGGGPAGIMASISASESGAKVVLIEKNKNLGKKLLITGKGRCNITNAEFNQKKFTEAFGKQGQFLLSGLSVFSAKHIINFFEKHGLETKIERGKRVFPKSDKARDVLNVLIKCLQKNEVQIKTDSTVDKIEAKQSKIISVILKNKQKIVADKYIICTGGKVLPETGSSGDGLKWVKQLGHDITKLRPGLVPLKIKEKWIIEAQGLSLKNVNLKVFQNQNKKDQRFGEMLFTHFGVSGPIILDMSKKISILLEKGDVKLMLDLKPSLDSQKLDRRIQRDFAKYSNKMFKNALSDLLPKKLIPIIITLSKINPDKKVNNITKKERDKLTKLLKALEMNVIGILGFDKAIITSGGISLEQIDSKTMKSKILKNLFFAGEIIDLDGPTGGYNLQLCWTTGYVAGQSAGTDMA